MRSFASSRADRPGQLRGWHPPTWDPASHSRTRLPPLTQLRLVGRATGPRESHQTVGGSKSSAHNADIELFGLQHPCEAREQVEILFGGAGCLDASQVDD